MTGSKLGRRRFLQGVGGAAVAAAGVPMLSACSSDSNGDEDGGTTLPEGEPQGSGLELPTYQRFEGVQPDLPGDGGAIPDAFLSYPANPESATDSPPGDGSDVTVVCAWLGEVPPSVDRNEYWQGLNERLDVNLIYQSVPSPDYDARAATVLAGGDMPDIMQIPNATARVPEVLESRFEDLTEYLAGDAVLDFPFLANMPEHVWEQSIYNGRIYGLRYPLFRYGNFMLARRDVLTEFGFSVDDVTDAESYAQLCRDVTDGSANRWALAQPRQTIPFVTEMLGKPSSANPDSWHEENGAFTFGAETDEYRQALDFIAGLWDEGVFHPDSLSLEGAAVIDEFKAGRILLDYRGGNQWGSRRTIDLDITAIPPYAFEGGGLGVKSLGKGTYTMSAISKGTDPDRIQMLLGVMNWLAAPFGTEEFLYRRYGDEGVHHTRNSDGDVELTDKGVTETLMPNGYVAQSPPWSYISGYPETTRERHEFLELVVPTGKQSAANGLWSATKDEKAQELRTALEDAIDGIFRGQNSLEDFDSALDDWRSNGGDDIRAELEAAFEERETA